MDKLTNDDIKKEIDNENLKLLMTLGLSMEELMRLAKEKAEEKKKRELSYERGLRMSDREAIRQELELRIINGEFPENAPILSVNDLSTQYEISTTTAMMIYNEMKVDNVLFASKGARTCVSSGAKEMLEEKHKKKFREMLYNTKEYCAKIGLSFGDEVEKMIQIK